MSYQGAAELSMYSLSVLASVITGGCGGKVIDRATGGVRALVFQLDTVVDPPVAE